jgi:hypothetical protein
MFEVDEVVIHLAVSVRRAGSSLVGLKVRQLVLS